MKFKGFEEMPADLNFTTSEATKEIANKVESQPAAEMVKVDRRKRLLSELTEEELVDKAIQALFIDPIAAQEISRRVNQSLHDMMVAENRKHEEDLQREFGNLSNEELAYEIFLEATHDEKMAKEITRRVNQSLRDRSKAQAKPTKEESVDPMAA